MGEGMLIINNHKIRLGDETLFQHLFLSFNSVINNITSFCVSNESNDKYGIKSLIFSPIQKNFIDGY